MDSLLSLYTVLERAGLAEHVAIDLSIVHEMEYYTGLVFRGYIEGAGEAVLGGGRYDTLLENFGESTPATGFGVNISVLADRLAKTSDGGAEHRVQCLIHYEPENLAAALEYAETSGKVCEFSCFDRFEDSLAYAAGKGISGVVRICGSNVVEVTRV